MSTLAVIDTAVWVLAAIGALSVVVLLLIVIAPSRRVRDEPPLDRDVEARLLLGEDPDEIAEDISDEEQPDRAAVAELRRDE